MAEKDLLQEKDLQPGLVTIHLVTEKDQLAKVLHAVDSVAVNAHLDHAVDLAAEKDLARLVAALALVNALLDHVVDLVVAKDLAPHAAASAAVNALLALAAVVSANALAAAHAVVSAKDLPAHAATVSETPKDQLALLEKAVHLSAKEDQIPTENLSTDLPALADQLQEKLGKIRLPKYVILGPSGRGSREFSVLNFNAKTQEILDASRQG